MLFLDIDYKELMIKKRTIVERTIELQQALKNIQVPAEGDVIFRSDRYLQIGCDLRDLERLERTLTSTIDVQTSHILFVAEVSITYMDAEYSDNLIEWASNLPHGRPQLLSKTFPELISHQHAFASLSNSCPRAVGIHLPRP